MFTAIISNDQSKTLLPIIREQGPHTALSIRIASWSAMYWTSQSFTADVSATTGYS